MLPAMGAKIDGVGTSTLVVEGVEALAPVDVHARCRDRIVAGTWAIGAVMTRGDVVIERAVGRRTSRCRWTSWSRAGATVDAARRRFPGRDGRPAAGVDIVTLPFPGFPTDLQPMAIALAAVSDGAALITENIFEGRFMFVNELVRLGADIRTDGHHAVVRGRERLSGAPVRPPTSGPGPAWCSPGCAPTG